MLKPHSGQSGYIHLSAISRVIKLSLTGHIRPSACFCATHKLSIVSTFLKGLNKETKNYAIETYAGCEVSNITTWFFTGRVADPGCILL